MNARNRYECSSVVPPVLSFVIPIYNRETLIVETLDSIVAQTCTDWECVVVDDGSTDGSAETVQHYAAQDSRIRLLHRPVDRIKGAPTCRNYGFENSSGNFVCFFDSDDLLGTEFLETLLTTFDAESEAEYAVVPYDYFVSSPSVRTRPNRNRFIPRRGTLFEQLMVDRLRSCTPCVLWRRSFLETLPMLWREGLPLFQDPDFIRRSLCFAKQGIWIDMPPGVHVRRDASSVDGIVATSTKNPLDRAKTVRFVHEEVYRCCTNTGRMSDRQHRMMLRFFFNVLLFHAVASGDRSVVHEFHELVVGHAEKTASDRLIRVAADAVYASRNILHALGILLGRFRASSRWFLS